MSKIHKYLKGSIDDALKNYEATGALPSNIVEEDYKDYLSLTRGREQKYMTFMSNYFKERAERDKEWYRR